MNNKEQPATRRQQERERAERFVASLTKLSPGEKAALRRAAGRSLSEARGDALRVFYKMCPGPLYHREITYFLISTLYFFNKYPGKGNFGEIMARFKNRIATKGGGLDRRFMALLDCQSEDDFPALGHHLRQLVKAAAAQQIGIDWAELLADLSSWRHPDRWVQQRWAQSYFGGNNANATPENEEAL